MSVRPLRAHRLTTARRRAGTRRSTRRSYRRVRGRAWISVRPPDLLELIAHELRTPLTSLYGAARLLERPALGDWTRGDLVVGMAHDAGRLVRFLDDLLAVADASSGNVRVEPVLVERLLSEVVLEVNADAPGATVVVEAGPAVVPALADPEALRHALANVLRHEMRGVDPGRSIRVSVNHVRGRIVVTIQRPADGREARAVEPGRRLWLAAAHALVKAMGGELLLAHRHGPGRVRLSLPAISVEPEPAGTPA